MGSTGVGFIGLGNMGMIMAKKLAEKEIRLTVFDLRESAIREMEALGAKSARSCREVAETSDVIISVVRDIPQTEAILFAKDGVWEGVREGTVIILSSSLSPAYCREVYARAKKHRVRIIDAPVSTEDRSFVPGKEFAVLTFMIGGDDDAIEQCRPIFEAMAKNVIPQGGIGAGQVCKLVNNLAYYGNTVVAQECINLGLKAGLDLEKMKKAMSLSTGNSRVLMGIGRANPFPPPPKPVTASSGGVKDESLGSKDKRLALEMAQEVGARTPVVELMETLDLAATYDALGARAKLQL
jgi:3-hydroxyisobutyrate dehydrogenase-like beta-hydroxyacid dehydrogenase